MQQEEDEEDEVVHDNGALKEVAGCKRKDVEEARERQSDGKRRYIVDRWEEEGRSCTRVDDVDMMVVTNISLHAGAHVMGLSCGWA